MNRAWKSVLRRPAVAALLLTCLYFGLCLLLTNLYLVLSRANYSHHPAHNDAIRMGIAEVMRYAMMVFMAPVLLVNHTFVSPQMRPIPIQLTAAFVLSYLLLYAALLLAKTYRRRRG